MHRSTAFICLGRFQGHRFVADGAGNNGGLYSPVHGATPVAKAC